MGLTTHKLIDTQQLVNATGAGVDVDVKDYKGQVDFYLNAKSSAGTSPTLTAKLQHSNLASGAGYITEGATENKLRDGTNSNIELAAAFTQSGVKQIKSVFLKMKKNGTVASGNLTLTIEGNSTADPDGTPIGTATVSTDDIPTIWEDVEFVFTNPISVADATVYHLVLNGAYTVHADNNVAWRSNTVASAGNLSFFDSAWAQTATQSLEFQAKEYAFADVTGGAFTEVAAVGSIQNISLNIDNLNRFVRVYRTIGGTSSPAFYESVFVRGYKDN